MPPFSILTMNLNGMGVWWVCVGGESRGSERIVNPERIEGAALAFAGGAAVNADLAADAADVQRRGRIESAALAMAV